MIKAFRWPQVLLLLFSLGVIYFLAPSLDRNQALLVSIVFALLLILSSGVVIDRVHIIRYLIYVFVDIGTYHILFSDEPWNTVFKAGLFDASAAPLIVASILMTINGFLIIKGRANRLIYAVLTLGVQIPVVFIIGEDRFQGVLTYIGQCLNYKGAYASYLQVWQLEWMLTYYLPIFFLNYNRDKR